MKGKIMEWYIENDELCRRIEIAGGKLNVVWLVRDNLPSVNAVQLDVNTEQGYVYAIIKDGVASFGVNLRAVEAVPASFTKFRKVWEQFQSEIMATSYNLE